MSAKDMTFCGNIVEVNRLGFPDPIKCPFSVFEKWNTSVLNETDGFVSSVGCTINEIKNLFI